MAVYLIHLEPAMKQARHYTGYTPDSRLVQRIEEHGSPRGSRLCRVANERGHELVLVRVWAGKGRDFERLLKRRKNAPKLCPLCNPRLYALPLPDLYADR